MTKAHAGITEVKVEGRLEEGSSSIQQIMNPLIGPEEGRTYVVEERLPADHEDSPLIGAPERPRPTKGA